MKKARTEMRKEGVRQDDFGSHVKVLRKVSAGARSRSRHVRPLGRVFTHFFFFAFREKSVSAPARKHMCVYGSATAFMLIPCFKTTGFSPPLLVTKDESFAFGSASSVGQPGQPIPSELVDGFDDSTVNIKESKARGRGDSPRLDHPIRSDDPGMVQ
ncbi:hypothetical protein VPH35_028799 [Triticum aestivum]